MKKCLNYSRKEFHGRKTKEKSIKPLNKNKKGKGKKIATDKLEEEYWTDSTIKNIGRSNIRSFAKRKKQNNPHSVSNSFRENPCSLFYSRNN